MRPRLHTWIVLLSRQLGLHSYIRMCYSKSRYKILYALECFNLTSAGINHLNVYWNSVYRKIFDFRPWESVKELICCLESMNFERLYSYHIIYSLLK